MDHGGVGGSARGLWEIGEREESSSNQGLLTP